MGTFLAGIFWAIAYRLRKLIYAIVLAILVTLAWYFANHPPKGAPPPQVKQPAPAPVAPM
jgi:hypothetical protein